MVLSACSSFFQKLLLENPCEHPTVIMPDTICFSDLQFIIEFVYRGEIDVSEAELQVGRSYQIIVALLYIPCIQGRRVKFGHLRRVINKPPWGLGDIDIPKKFLRPEPIRFFLIEQKRIFNIKKKYLLKLRFSNFKKSQNIGNFNGLVNIF